MATQEILQAAVEQRLLQATKVIENQLDNEIDRMDKMDADDLDKLREQRLQQMKKARSQKEQWMTQGHGQYTEITEEKEFFDICKKSNKVVCHYFRDSTFRCKIVDKHLIILAPKHLETRFIKLNVERAPFLCDRLRIRVLPTISCVIDSITKDYIKGFDELGGHDDFSTEMLEWRLGCAGVINYSGNLSEPPDVGKPAKKQVNFRAKKTIRESAQDSDSDD
ncbi:thioredoxin domain-containing protein 9-like [Halichondria panicea]|uniref:thioredoxin domain-containing protein 9-like n=1 Tax=Halichondria panicea TaxID=6063 RepID=UPI00312B81BE